MKIKKSNIVLFATFAIILIILLIFYGIYHNNSSHYGNIKIDKNKNLVFTSEEKTSGNYYQYVPFVNIKTEIGILVNKDISEFISYFDKDNISISYESNVSGKLLSLIIKVEDHSYVESAAILYFKSYNINLDTLNIVDNNVLLSYFNKTSSDIEPILNQRIEEYYSKLVSDNVIDSTECDYNCFLNRYKFEKGLDDISYYVRDGKLIVFKPYTYVSSVTSEESVVYDFEIG